MRIQAGLTAAILTAVMGLAPLVPVRALAQGNAPMDLPPASYQGRQYVDSAGCVFVRAGYDEAVRWVPRVNRDRSALCGYKPTFAAGDGSVLDLARVAPETPAATPSEAPAAPAPAARVARTAPAPEPAGGTGRTGAPMRTIASQMATRPAPTTSAPARPMRQAATIPVTTPVASPVAVQITGPTSGYVSPYAAEGAAAAMSASGARIASIETVSTTACPNGVTTAERYTLSTGRRVLRCGAPVADPAAFINAANVPGLMTVTGPVAGSGTPSGYVSPYALGGAEMASAAPRRSGTRINHNTTALPPGTGTAAPQTVSGYVSPYAVQAPIPEEVYVRLPRGPVGLAPVRLSSTMGESGYRPAFEDGRLNPYRGPRSGQGDAQMGQIWSKEVPARLVTPNTPARRRIVASQAPVHVTPAPMATYSSKNVAPAAAPSAASGRYVQVGSFGVAENAGKASARLRAMGLPVATSRGKGLQIVLAGPFASGAELSAALGAARSAGFGDAFIR